MPKPIIVVTIEGGVVQAIPSNHSGVRVIVTDHDKDSEFPLAVSDWEAEKEPKVIKWAIERAEQREEYEVACMRIEDGRADEQHCFFKEEYEKEPE